jgi:hypothetical protein
MKQNTWPEDNRHGNLHFPLPDGGMQRSAAESRFARPAPITEAPAEERETFLLEFRL